LIRLRSSLNGLIVKSGYSAVALIWFFPVSYFAVLLGHLILIEQGASQPRVHLFALVVSSCTCLTLWLIDLVLAKTTTNPISAVIKLVAVVIVGGVRGAAIYYLGIYLQLDSGVPLGYRIWNSMVTTIVWLGLLSYIINKQREFQARYRRLISQSILKESSGISETELTGYLTQIEQSLKAIKFDTNRPDQLASAAREVKTQIDELIRPLSKRLWLDSITSYPKIKFTKVLVDSIIELKVAILPLAIFHLATSIINLTSVISFTEATTRSLVNLAVVLVLYFGLSKIRFNQAAIGFSFGIFKLVLFAVLPSLISEYFHSIVLFENQSPITVFALLPLPVLMIGFSITRIIGSDRNYLINAMKQELRSPNPNYQKTQVASYLHNSLQSELLALSRKLEAAAGSDDANSHRASLEQLAALLNRSISEDFANFYESPKERLEQVIENWAGILEIKIINKEAIFVDPNKSVIAVQLIEELASNANKHSTVTELNFECFNANEKLLLKLKLTDASNLAALRNFNFRFTQSKISFDSESLTNTIIFEIE
jgi:hypothetical protein